MNIMEHSDQGATIKLNQRELLLAMALVQEGRESFGCNTESGRALDALFTTANMLVEVARRRNLRRPTVQQKIRLVDVPAKAQRNAASSS